MWKRNVIVAAGLAVALAVSAHQHVVFASADHIDVPDTVVQRDVAIVLGAGLNGPGVPGPVLVDRLQLALDLHRSGKVQKILVSGDNDGRGLDEVNPMRRWLLDRGVPSADVYMDHAGFRTHDTMRRAAHVFEVRSAIVCTQSFHLARSVYLARGAGIDAVGVAAPEVQWRETRYAHLREAAARIKAVADVAFDREPRWLGERIPIASAPSSATHDANS